MALNHLCILSVGHNRRVVRKLLEFQNAILLFAIPIICGNLENEIYILKYGMLNVLFRLAREYQVCYLILHYLHSNMSAYNYFRDAGKTHETLRSETK